MADSSYDEFVLEQLRRVAPITTRRMFGALGIYSQGLFFAIIADDTLYFKVDDANRPDFEAEGMGPFRPYGDDSLVMQYYEVPPEVLESPDRLREWVGRTIDVARRSRSRRK